MLLLQKLEYSLALAIAVVVVYNERLSGHIWSLGVCRAAADEKQEARAEIKLQLGPARGESINYSRLKSI